MLFCPLTKKNGNRLKESQVTLIVLCLAIAPILQWSAQTGIASGLDDASSRSPDQGGWTTNYTVAALGPGTNTPSVAVSNDTVHCVYVNVGVHYSRSLDGGHTWGQAREVSAQGTSGALTPSVSVNGSDVYIVWVQEVGGPSTHELFYTKSNDSGTSFTAPVMLSGVTGHLTRDVKVLAYGDVIYVVWADDRDDPSAANQEVYLKRSDDRGTTWGSDQRITYAGWPSWHPWIGVVGNTVHLVWEDERLGGTHRIYYKRSMDKGATWTADLMISSPSIDVVEPSFSLQGQTLHAVWSMEPNDIQYRRSTDGGLTWEAIRTIIGGDSISRHEPFVKAFGNFVQVLWNQNGDLQDMNSTDGGSTFGLNLTLGTDMDLILYEWGYQLLDSDANGSYLVYSYKDSEIRFRYKGLLPDLAVSAADVEFSDPYGSKGTTYVDMNVTVHNLGSKDAARSTMDVHLDDPGPSGLVLERTIGPVEMGSSLRSTVTLAPAYLSSAVYIVIKGTAPFETALSNNQANVTLNITAFFPKVDLSVDSNITLTGQNVTFTVNKSADPKGVIPQYDLAFGDGNSTGWSTLGTAASVSHSYLENGAYPAILQVRSWKGVESEAGTVNMTVKDRPPRARLNVTTPGPLRKSLTVINFSAEKSSDIDGRVVRYLWDFGDGQNATTMNASHVYQIPRTYKFGLKVWDDDNSTNETRSQINILDQLPVAVITVFDSNITHHKGDLINFTASSSYDLDGSIVSYVWDFGDGTNRTGLNVSHRYKALGNYDVRLTVMDDLGNKGTAEHVIGVDPSWPKATASANETDVLSLVPIKFTAVASDLDGTIVIYEWYFGDGTGSTIKDPEYTYPHPGRYDVELVVHDDDNFIVKCILTINVRNRAPIAKAHANSTLVYTDDKILFSASESIDPDGSIVAYVWLMPYTIVLDGVNVSSSFAAPGNYTVRLEVTDDHGAVSMQDIKVQVVARPAKPKPHGSSWPMVLSIAAGVSALVIVVMVLAFVILRSGKGRSSDDRPVDKAATVRREGKKGKRPE